VARQNRRVAILGGKEYHSHLESLRSSRRLWYILMMKVKRLALPLIGVGRKSEERVMKKLGIILVTFCLSGCGAISATSLRCGTDGDDSYVELVSAPQNVGSNGRVISEICAFAYDRET